MDIRIFFQLTVMHVAYFLGVQRGLSGEIGWNEIEDDVFLSTLQVATVQNGPWRRSNQNI